jgi:hypothetical protein
MAWPAEGLALGAIVAFSLWLWPLPPPGCRPFLRLLVAAAIFTGSRSLLDAMAAEAAMALSDAVRPQTAFDSPEVR